MYRIAWAGWLLACLVLVGSSPSSLDWKELVQKPYVGRPVPDLGLRPLLVAADGKKIVTRAEWEQARKALQKTWLAQLGQPPEKPARLDVRIAKTEKGDGYTRQLLSFVSEDDDRIRAYLLTPVGVKEGEKRPAVVVFHQTTKDTLRSPVGLGQKPELGLALQLARRGYVTLSPECYLMKDEEKLAKGQRAGDVAKAQTDALVQRRAGWTGMGKMTFDASRCVDFLESLPLVDRERIGCIGFSLGAKEVLYAMAFEPRYKVGVFDEGGIGLRMSNWTDPWYFGAKIKPHIPALEHHQVLALAAPRPFLILGGDSADGEASWPFVKAVLPVYELLGAGDRIGLYNHKGKHSFPKEARRLSYRWLDHWLRFTPERDEVGE